MLEHAGVDGHVPAFGKVPLTCTSLTHAWIHIFYMNYTYILDHSPRELFRANETITTEQQLLTGQRQTSWLFTRASEKLSQGSRGGQNGSWTSRQAPILLCGSASILFSFLRHHYQAGHTFLARTGQTTKLGNSIIMLYSSQIVCVLKISHRGYEQESWDWVYGL